MGLLSMLRNWRRPPDPLIQPGRPCFVSIRDDGLCMRLNTILDAAVFAAAYDGSYGFYWDEAETPALDQQTTASAAAVFDAGFLARHCVGGHLTVETAPTASFPDRLNPIAVAAWLTEGAGAGALYLDRPRNLAGLFRHRLVDQKDVAYVRAFDALRFSSEAARAIAAARSINLGENAVAIHLRGGDILHGTFSHMATYLHKAPSVPEIAAQIENLTPLGCPVWLIGQEPDVQQALAHRYPQVRAFGVTDQRPQLSDVGDVLFDAIVMSRMTQLFGGNSGVTMLSTRLGNVPFSDISRSSQMVSIPDLLDDPMARADYEAVAATTKSHAYAKAVIAAPAADWSSDHLRLIDLALRYRPASKFLQLIRISLLVALGQARDGETLAKEWLVTPMDSETEPRMAYAFLQGGAHYFPVAQTAPLAAVSAADCPALALFGSLRAYFMAPSPETKGQVLAELDQVETALFPRRVDPALRPALIEAFAFRSE